MNWDTVYDQGTDVNLNINYFLNQFEKIFNKHAPQKKIGKKKAKLFLFPWINEEIRKGMKTRDKLHSKFTSCKNKELKAILWSRYKTQRNEVTEQLVQEPKVKKNIFIQPVW